MGRIGPLFCSKMAYDNNNGKKAILYGKTFGQKMLLQIVAAIIQQKTAGPKWHIFGIFMLH
jgi:hypothetical protein